MDAMQVLVIILSVFLAIFLILAIVLIVELIRVTKQIRLIASTTQHAVEHVSNLAATATKFASPALLIRLLGSQLRKYMKSTKKKSKEGK